LVWPEALSATRVLASFPFLLYTLFFTGDFLVRVDGIFFVFCSTLRFFWHPLCPFSLRSKISPPFSSAGFWLRSPFQRERFPSLVNEFDFLFHLGIFCRVFCCAFFHRPFPLLPLLFRLGPANLHCAEMAMTWSAPCLLLRLPPFSLFFGPLMGILPPSPPLFVKATRNGAGGVFSPIRAFFFLVLPLVCVLLLPPPRSNALPLFCVSCRTIRFR